MKITNTFGKRLNLIRRLKNSTQTFIAEKANLSSRLIRNYESGTRNPTNDSIQKIANALEVDIWALKDIDIDINNQESVRQLFLQLEEKGLFDINDVNLKLEYIDHKPKYSINIDIPDNDNRDKIVTDIISWQMFKSRKDLADENNKEYEYWKYNIPSFKNDIMSLITKYQDLFTTGELLKLDLISAEDALQRVIEGKYESEDIKLLMQRLDGTTSPPENVRNMLYDIFINDYIPPDIIYDLFEKPNENFPNANPFNGSYVKEIYEQAKNDKKKNENQSPPKFPPNTGEK